jgi:signal transduction histidine kinase
MLTTGSKLALLAQTFAGLSLAELDELAGLTRVKRYPPDTLLCREGAHEDTFYILARGEALISKKISDQEGERVMRRVGPGDYVGEMALIQNAPRAASVRTLGEVEALEIAKADFEDILNRSPRLAMSVIRTTLSRMRANDQVAITDLQRTNRVLAQLDRNKLEFIEVAAHELRTPLTVMMGYLNVLKLDPNLKADPQLAEVLEGLSHGTERLHEVVNAMLDVTRIDSDKPGGVRISVAPVPLRSVVNDLVSRLKNDAQGRQLQIVIEHSPDTPAINADPTLIQKALHHVIINAIKYTPDGGRILIRTRPVTLLSGEPGAEISVQDTGIGLDPEHHELVFEKFYQVGSVALHSSGKTIFKGGGPGLGLAIARGVVRAHGGRIWVESAGHDETHYRGSTFFLQFPIHPRTAQ